MEDGALLETLFGSVTEVDLELALEMVVNEAVEEVMNSTNLQPSVPGVVCEVISDIVQSVSVANIATVSDAVNGNAANSNGNAANSNVVPAELFPHNAQVC